MGYKQIKALVKKEILRLIKEPALLFLIVIFPIALTLSFGVAFGQVGDGGESTYSIGWVNYDDNQTHWATSFRSNLSSNEMLRLEDYNSLDDALDKLQAGELSGVVVVPDNFGDSIESYWNSPQDTGSWINSSVELYVDESSLVMKQTLTPLIQQSYVDTLYGSEQTTIETPVDVELISAVETKETSMFDVFMPGLFAFGVIFLTMSIAQGITGEKKEGLLKRINCSVSNVVNLSLGFGSWIPSNPHTGKRCDVLCHDSSIGRFVYWIRPHCGRGFKKRWDGYGAFVCVYHPDDVLGNVRFNG